MEDTTFLPVALFIPAVAVFGIVAVTVATVVVLNRRRRRRRLPPGHDTESR